MFKTFIGLAALAAASAASAVTINFNTAPNPVGNTSMYTSGGLSVTATGYASAGTETGLYTKTCTGICDENGLGLAGYTDSEINKGTDFIQLDVSSILSKVSSASFFMNSTTGGEWWAVYGTDSVGTLSGASLVLNGSDETSHALGSWGDYSYYDFVALGTKSCTWQGCSYSAGNVLLGGLSLTAAVPEPSTWAMMLIGFAGIGMAARRKAPSRLPQVA